MEPPGEGRVRIISGKLHGNRIQPACLFLRTSWSSNRRLRQMASEVGCALAARGMVPTVKC